MPFTAALSTAPRTEEAVADVCRRVQEQLPDQPDLAMLFFSPHHLGAAEVCATAAKRLQARCLLGCVGEAIVGNDEEVEDRPAVSLWAGKWKKPIQFESFHLVFERTAEGNNLLGRPDGLMSADPASSALLVLGDPMTFPADLLLKRVNSEHPQLRVMGGMASGAFEEGMCRLLRDGEVVTQGAVGVLLQGPIGLRGIVSQGCRPIGRHYVITRGEENLIRELGGRPALARLQELWEELTPHDRELVQQGLHVGLVINEYQGEFQRGDFLVRNVMGLDRQTGALAITDHIRVGQTVQFHVRDAQTADEDLHALLQLDVNAHDRRPSAALLFSCNGRGTRLFPEPNHDAQTIRTEAGAIPLAGLFAAGELGPVGGKNFMHGFTASVALFEE